MSVRIANNIRDGLREKLWAQAESLGWANLSGERKSAQYDIWTKDPEVGGILGLCMDQHGVRVYIKDTIMKGYGRWRLANPTRVLRTLGLPEAASVKRRYERPHGRLLLDGRVICWGNASEWKAIVTAVHERAFSAKASPGDIVLLASGGKFADTRFRTMVEDAAGKLGIPRVLWLE